MKHLASISLDLDNLWSYLKIHGDPNWTKLPSYLDRFIPHVLDLLDQFNLKITFFIVGQDAALDKNKNYFQEIIKRGHEVANHSFHHESWLYKSAKTTIEKDILTAEEYIEKLAAHK